MRHERRAVANAASIRMASVHRGHSDRSDVEQRRARGGAVAATADDSTPRHEHGEQQQQRRRSSAARRPPRSATAGAMASAGADGAGERGRPRAARTFSASTIMQEVPRAGSRPRRAAPARAAARARCAAAPWPGRRCRAAARGRRASGTSTGRCSPPGETPPAARPVRDRIGAEVAQRVLDRRATDRAGASGGASTSRTLIALLVGKEPPEVRLRHQQLALKDAVAQRGHEPQPDLACRRA